MALTDVEDLAGAELREGGEEIGEQGEEAFELVCGDVNDKEGEAESLEIVFVFDAFIDGEEDVEVFFGERKELAVFHATPARFGDRFYRVAWKGSTDACVNTLI